VRASGAQLVARNADIANHPFPISSEAQCPDEVVPVETTS